MIPIKNNIKNKNYLKKYIIFIFILALFLSFFIIPNRIFALKINLFQNLLNREKNSTLKIVTETELKAVKKENSDFYKKNCYLPLDKPNISINHLIITRFLFIFPKNTGFHMIKNPENYIRNGLRVMKKYLIPSLENQSCKDFTWIILLGNQNNITLIESLFDFNISINYKFIYLKELKIYIKNITKGIDISITTRIDYDDIIYYDAVNDVRKAINFEKPMILYGYNRGVYYYEVNGKYYDFYSNFNNFGVMSIFASLIQVLSLFNDTYSIYDIGQHTRIRRALLEKYMLFGLKKLDYEPAIFDSGSPKFIWVRQKYSGMYNHSISNINNLKENKFNISKFYGY